MSEVTDIIVPILQRIQPDLADVKRDLGETKRDLGGKMDVLTERMDAFEDYFTYTMGLTEQNKADIKRLSSQIKALQAKLDGKDR